LVSEVIKQEFHTEPARKRLQIFEKITLSKTSKKRGKKTQKLSKVMEAK
jgi:hypothetical protein